MGDGLRIFVPWPRYPVITRMGKPSRARTAGKPLPWLSANVINNLPPPLYRSIKERWEEAGRNAADGLAWLGETPCVLDVTLRKRTAQNMDPFAVLEGLKPIIDGLVRSEPGIWPDDNDNFVRGGTAIARKAPAPESLGVSITIRALWSASE